MHAHSFRWTVAALALCFAACASTPATTTPANTTTPATTTPAAGDNPLFALDGTWSGKVHGFRAPGLSERPLDYELWITIEGERADLWFRYEDRWARLWNGAQRFAIARHKSNAILSASNSKPSVECHWVETWSLTLSQFKPGALEALFYRIVNNTGCPDVAGTQFAYGATGRLMRVSSAVQAPQPAGEY